MRLHKNIAVSESGLVFNPVTGESFTVNPVGLEIIGLLQEGKSNDEIRTILLERYNTESPTVEKDIQDFISQMGHLQLLETDEKAF